MLSFFTVMRMKAFKCISVGLFVALLSFVIVSCSKSRSEISWEEKKIEELGFVKSKTTMNLSDRINNQKQCEEYGKANWGETENYGDWLMFQQFMYSPLFDKCFVLRTSDNFKDDEHMLIIFDVLSANGSIADYSSFCRKAFLNSSDPELIAQAEEECPSEENVRRLWVKLIGS